MNNIQKTTDIMCRIIKAIVILLFLVSVAFFTGCDLSGDGDENNSEEYGSDGGDAFDGTADGILPPAEEITELESGIPFEGYIESPGNQDWYKIEALAGEIMQITLAMGGSDVDPVIWSYAQKGGDAEEIDKWVWSDLDGSDGVNLATDQLAIVQDNIYYFRVLDNDVQSAWSHGWYDGDEFSETVPYFLTVSITEDPDANEPINNDHNGAVSATSGIATDRKSVV